MSTTPEFGWPLIEPTDFVTNLPADFESFADAVDDDLKGLKGGTAGQVLVKDSSTDLDFIWAAPAGGPAGFTLLNTGGTALTGATVTVSGISGQNTLLIFVRTASTNTASDRMIMRFNSDTAANYAQTGFELDVAANSGFSNYLNDGYITLARMGDSAAGQVRGCVTVHGANSTDAKIFSTAFGATGANTNVSNVTQGFYQGTSTISSVSITTVLGNSFDAGTIYVYGSAN